MIEKRTFIDLFYDPSPALNVKFFNTPDEKPQSILVKNLLGPLIDNKRKKYVESICRDPRLNEFSKFYCSHDGLEFCKPVYPDNCSKVPLLTLIPSRYISDFTKQYTKGGKWAWTIDLNKSKSLYRDRDTWVIFARVAEGPSCLSVFLTGENAGCIYLVAPQPAFNILKPIAKTFNLFLDRVAKDPAAFLRLVRSYVRIRGADGQHYGFAPVEYIGNSNVKV
jgi:hypothetical protein